MYYTAQFKDERSLAMENKKIFSDKALTVICMAVCFAAGFVVGALLAPHHNRLEFVLFSGNGSRNGNGNRDNSANFGSGGISEKKTDKNRKSKRS